jgi:hypothetical protein
LEYGISLDDLVKKSPSIEILGTGLWK